MFNALGGWNTVYFTGVAGMAGHMSGHFKSAPAVAPLAGRAGIMSLARNAGWVGGPVIAGVAFSAIAFGDVNQLKSLCRNFFTYKSEINMINSENFFQ